jgi:hypothetical protein
MIFFVNDFFVNQIQGGAELTAESLIESSLSPIIKINSHNITRDLIHRLKKERWIFGNVAGISDFLLLEIIKNISDYSVVEYDYKYCKYRSSHKHIFHEGMCECQTTQHAKLFSIFLYKAKNTFWMSEGQRDEYIRLFPFLGKANNIVLNSPFSEASIEHILSLNTSKKNNKFLILNSNSWIKGTKDCIEYAEQHNLEYELVQGLAHKQLLEKLAQSRGLIFLSKGLDTCPRIVIEAKLLGCELILNDYVQHKDDEWFAGDIIDHMREKKKIFFEKCLDSKLTEQKYDENIKFHFIVPCYNAEKWISKTIQSIKLQSNLNYTATIIDDVSSDKTHEVVLKTINDKFKVIKNQDKNYALKNIATAIENIKPDGEDVIVVLDGDDWLSSSDVLNYLTGIYNEENPILTYGSYEEFPTGRRGIEPSEYPPEVVKNNKFRQDQWRASHLRTFKYKLWRQIDQKDLLDEDGHYYKMSYDQAMMLPMLEMAGDKSKYIDNVLHVYNRANPLNVDKQKAEQQHKTMLRIRSKKPYSRVFK